MRSYRLRSRLQAKMEFDYYRSCSYFVIFQCAAYCEWHRAKNYVSVYGLIFIGASCLCFNVCVLTVVSWRLCLQSCFSQLYATHFPKPFPFGHVHGFISMQTLCLIKFCQKELSIYFSSTHSHTLSLWLLDIQCAKIQFFIALSISRSAFFV